MLDANKLIGTHDVLFVTLDTLRYDVACRVLELGKTPNLAAVLPGGLWEERHSPGSFTYAAHQAFFAGFLPTPALPGRHPRLFATAFPGSETTGPTTCVFNTPDIVSGLAGRGYHTVCIGGVGFFNKQTPLGGVLPGLFAESHWNEALGVTELRSTGNQVRLAAQIIERQPNNQRLFLFLNVSALHQPNCGYVSGATEDSPETQAAALAYVDRCLPPLFAATAKPCAGVYNYLLGSRNRLRRGQGYVGHRVGHPVVWTVPVCRVCLAGESPHETACSQRCSGKPRMRRTRIRIRIRPLTGPCRQPVKLRDVWADERRDALFLYLHVPFCEMRCGFCNLFTTANPQASLEARYLDALQRQARQVSEALGAGHYPPHGDWGRHADLSGHCRAKHAV